MQLVIVKLGRAEATSKHKKTGSIKSLYHVKISPDPKEPALTPEQWTRAIEAVRDEFGLDGHAYAAVMHRKYGAAHSLLMRAVSG